MKDYLLGLKPLRIHFRERLMKHTMHAEVLVGIADDILVYETESNFDLHLHEVMEATRQAGMKLNYDKCIIKTQTCSIFLEMFTLQQVCNQIQRRWKP